MPNLHEICELRVSRGYNAVDVSFHLGPLVICECLVAALISKRIDLHFGVLVNGTDSGISNKLGRRHFCLDVRCDIPGI